MFIIYSLYLFSKCGVENYVRLVNKGLELRPLLIEKCNH